MAEKKTPPNAPRTASHSVGLRPLTNRDAIRVCNLAGITQAENTLVTLKAIRKGLGLAISDLESQTKSSLRASHFLLVARWTKATCDAFVSMAEALSRTDKAKLVKNVYEPASVVFETASKKVAGQPVNYVDAGLSMAKKTAGLVAPTETMGYVFESGVAKVEVLVAAMNAKPKDVLKLVGEYLYDLHTFAFEQLTMAQAARVMKIMKAVFSYHEDLARAVNEMVANDLFAHESRLARQAVFITTARRVQQRIDELDAFVNEYDRKQMEKGEIRLRPAPSLTL